MDSFNVPTYQEHCVSRKLCDIKKEAQSEEESHDDLPLSTLKINVQCGKPGASCEKSNRNEELKEIVRFAEKFRVRRCELGVSQRMLVQAFKDWCGEQISQATLSRFESMVLQFPLAVKLHEKLKHWLEEAEQARSQGPLAFAAFLKGAGRKWRLSTRKTFNSRQLLFLQTFYCKTKHPTSRDIELLSEKLDCSSASVRKWFETRRMDEIRQRERLVRDFYKPTPDAALRRLGNEEDRRLSADVISTVTKKAVVKEEVLPEGYSRGKLVPTSSGLRLQTGADLKFSEISREKPKPVVKDDRDCINLLQQHRKRKLACPERRSPENDAESPEDCAISSKTRSETFKRECALPRLPAKRTRTDADFSSSTGDHLVIDCSQATWPDAELEDFFATVESMMSWCSGKEPIVPVYDVKPEHVKPLTELFQPRRDSSPRKFTDEAHSDQPAMTSTVVPSPGRESMASRCSSISSTESPEDAFLAGESTDSPPNDVTSRDRASSAPILNSDATLFNLFRPKRPPDENDAHRYASKLPTVMSRVKKKECSEHSDRHSHSKWKDAEDAFLADESTESPPNDVTSRDRASSAPILNSDATLFNLFRPKRPPDENDAHRYASKLPTVMSRVKKECSEHSDRHSHPKKKYADIAECQSTRSSTDVQNPCVRPVVASEDVNKETVTEVLPLPELFKPRKRGKDHEAPKR